MMLKYQQVEFIDSNNKSGVYTLIQLSDQPNGQYVASVVCDGVFVSGMTGIQGATVSAAFDSAIKLVKNAGCVNLWPNVCLMVSNGMLTDIDVENVLTSNGVAFSKPVKTR